MTAPLPDGDAAAPRVFNVLCGEAPTTRETPYGRTGTLVDERGFAVVLVEKAAYPG